LTTVNPDQLIVTHYDTYFYRPHEELRRVIDWLELGVDQETIQRATASINREHKHQIALQPVLSKNSKAAIQYYKAFCALAGPVYQAMVADSTYQLGAVETIARSLSMKVEALQQKHSITEVSLVEAVAQLETERTRTASLQAERTELSRRYERDSTRVNAQLADALLDVQQLAEQSELRIQAEAALENLRNEQDQLAGELDRVRSLFHTIFSSRSWHLLQGWWKFNNRLFPPGSTRQRAYILVRAAFSTLLTEGPFALATRSVRWIRRERRYSPSRRQRSLDVAPMEKFLSHPFSDAVYAVHMEQVEPTESQLNRQFAIAQQWNDSPAIHIVTPVYNPPLAVLQETVRSVTTQTYPNWQWHIVDAGTDETTWTYLNRLAKQETRIKLTRKKTNDGISLNTNVALQQVHDGFIAILDHDDTIAPNALFEVANCIREFPETDFVYSDSDKLDERGYRCEPFLKPDWSPELLLSANYLCHLSVFRTILLEKTGYFNAALDGAQDWDLFLRVTEHTNRIRHIPQILYHWRMTPQSTAQNRNNKTSSRGAQREAISDHLKRTGLQGVEVFFDMNHPIHSVYPLSTWKQAQERRVSIIIPSKDAASYLRKCLHTLYRHTTYPNYEVILVDTGSAQAETYELYTEYESRPNFRIVQYAAPFNFGKACNFGAQHATGELMLFLNNDTEIISPHWLTVMAQWFERPGIGIVGAKLLYPNRTLQHAGVIVGMGGLASHVFGGRAENQSTIFGPDGWYRNFLAVTGACMLISATAFEDAGGFDEGYILNYSDVQLCLRVCELGYRIVYTPHARLIHHESISHGRRIPRSDFERAYLHWQHWIQTGDPYFNCHLTYRNTTPQFKIDLERDTAAATGQSLMKRLPQKELILLPDDLMQN
jgi:GT2 family glycosyltransferase